MTEPSIRSTHPAELIGVRLLAGIVLILSAKGIWDIALSDQMPTWFRIGFSIGVVCVLYFSLRNAFIQQPKKCTVSRRLEWATWCLLALSFICTSSLHSFSPFHSRIDEAWKYLPSLRLNFIMTGSGLLIALILGACYLAGKRNFATLAMIYLCLLLFIPNDDCANPFNYWWIEHIGASPLMFVPNVMAAILASFILQGITPRLNVAALTGVCLCTLALGMSHRTGIAW